MNRDDAEEDADELRRLAEANQRSIGRVQEELRKLKARIQGEESAAGQRLAGPNPE